MADLLLRDTDREQLIRDTVTEVTKALEPIIQSSTQPLLVDGDRMAELIGVSRATIDRGVRDGTIPSVMIGRSRRFSPNGVVGALEKAGQE